MTSNDGILLHSPVNILPRDITQENMQSKDKKKRMKLLHLLLLLGISSCASTLTEDEQYEKDDRETLRRERFEQLVAECEAVHGHVVIEGYGISSATKGGKLQAPGAGQKYYCKTR